MRSLLAAALLAAPILLHAPKAHAPGATAPQAYEDMAVDLLRRYLQIDTTNPPGHELAAAEFLRDVLAREGISAEIDAFAPGRANLIATLPGTGAARPLVLAGHMDVVPADPSRWSVPPFAGVVKDGLVYGRGAEDMKTETVLHVMTLVRAKRESVRFARDLILLGTADEESGFAGALRAVSPEGWRARLAKAEYVITEGGENITRADGEPAYFGIDTAEKGAFWLKLNTMGTPGHGSQPIPDSALNRLIRALDRIRQHETPLKVTPTVERFFRDQAAQAGERAAWYRDMKKAITDPAAAKVLTADRDVAAQIRNTVSITVVHAGYKTNVIPGTAEAELDVRLLPGESPDAFLDELRRVVGDPSVTITPDKDFHAPNASPGDTPLFRTIESVLGRHYPGVPVTTKMLSGATECVLYRPLGIACYGFTPLLTSGDEVATAHGDDERIREATVRRSTGVFYDVVSELAMGR